LRYKMFFGVMLGLVAIVSVATPAFSQERAGDVAIGYSVLHDSDAEETFPMGWLFAAGVNLGSNVALVGEAGGNYKTVDVLGTDVNLRVHSFLGGVRIQNHQPKVMPFGQILVGVAHAGVSMLGEGVSSNDLAIQPGGGVLSRREYQRGGGYAAPTAFRQANAAKELRTYSGLAESRIWRNGTSAWFPSAGGVYGKRASCRRLAPGTRPG
jgi:hypothetical protein